MEECIGNDDDDGSLWRHSEERPERNGRERRGILALPHQVVKHISVIDSILCY